MLFSLLLCMFLMCTMFSFVVSSQGRLVKLDAVLMLLIGSLVFSAPQLTLTLPA